MIAMYIDSIWLLPAVLVAFFAGMFLADWQWIGWTDLLVGACTV